MYIVCVYVCVYICVCVCVPIHSPVLLSSGKHARRRESRQDMLVGRLVKLAQKSQKLLGKWVLGTTDPAHFWELLAQILSNTCC